MKNPLHAAYPLVLSASGSLVGAIQIAKEIKEDLLVVARAAYISEVETLKAPGADVVVSSEGEVALAMTERLLVELGATAEQLDRARDRVRDSLGVESSFDRPVAQS